MNWQHHIVSNNDVLLGKPTIKGTRLSIEHIISLFAQGWTEQQVLDNYPRLTQNDLKAVFTFIHECMQDGMLISSFKKTA